MSEFEKLRMKMIVEVLANIYSHIHEDTEEKVRRARLVVDEIFRQENSDAKAEAQKIPGSCF